MLHITNIDDCNFSMYGDLIGIAGLKVLGKTDVLAKASEPVYNESQGRITIYNSSKQLTLVGRKPVDELNLDGTVYLTSQEFVVAFNNLMNQCCCNGGESTTTEEITTTSELDGELLSNEEDEILLTNEDGQRLTLNE